MKSPDRARIFAIGLNKTGTSSLHEALEILGYTGLHFAGPERAALIRRAIEEERPLLHYLDPGYDAFSDTPVTTYFWLADVQYPGSKFILTVRDVDEWLDSRRRHVEKNQERAAAGAYAGKFLEVHLPAWEHEYRRHEGMVRSYFAHRPDDLLVFDVTAGEGWEPLCDFLGLPVPQRPFPWENRYTPWRGNPEPASREAGR
jgi:Sulfotransferase domain